MFYIYILYSSQADKYYVGHSHDPWQRLQQHLQNSADKFTGKHKDWRLAAVFSVSNQKGDADRLEKFIKRQKSRKLIELLIDPNFKPTDELAGLTRTSQVHGASVGSSPMRGAKKALKSYCKSFFDFYLFLLIFFSYFKG